MTLGMFSVCESASNNGLSCMGQCQLKALWGTIDAANCVACSILSLAETRNRALTFSREMDFMRWFPFFYLDPWRIRTHNPCVMVRTLNHCTTAPMLMHLREITNGCLKSFAIPLATGNTRGTAFFSIS